MNIATANRFWSKVVVGDPDSCWPWRCGVDKDGYGKFSGPGRNTLKAHRVAWSLFNRTELLKGAVVRHSCDNPPCCNPAHLSSGTHLDNMIDRDSRGRQKSGRYRPEHHGKVKLTGSDVRLIRARWKMGGISKSALGRLFGVNAGAILAIVIRQRQTWRDKEYEPTESVLAL